MARRKSIDTSIADRQKIGTFVLNGRTFVSGLHWETLDNVSSFMKEARSKGRQWGMDVVATRKGVDLRSKEPLNNAPQIRDTTRLMLRGDPCN
ncbi:hypothetical protein QYG06_19760 [Xanthomonas euvesicatoria]|uniref:hypothetical protein n=1 Tax=Xanthomonas euvesicatoria TaxID=456327 RepID=UPI00321A3E1E